MRLSVLDQSTALSGRAEDESIRETVALARHCDTLGYHRFWVSEHHGHPAIVGSAPEVLLAAIAVQTSRIRIGSAGVMLPHYSALKVAEQFRVLEALAPGRVDLGVGRAPGSDMRTAQALNPNARHAAERFPQQVQELQAWLEGSELPPEHPSRGITAHPRGPGMPALWMLGSSDYGAQLAARLGWPYAFAYFFADGQGAGPALELYRALFKPSDRLAQPQATFCVFALAADDEATAWRAFASRERWRLDRARGRLGPLPSPQEALARPLDTAEQAQVQALRQDAAVGTARQVGDKLRALADRYELDELVIVTWAHDPALRRRSYELLAAEFGLA
ncbi:LLM class flavin-dependent oxidoreductase [Ideonella sp. BN130291]|uniref:LLM class flavin-dependent oxidoreductase n=1 Tax=Ideonella sp. BN130291 TaxID=3112940 RepID=UPI002E255679|nr:LLM class flavin-dependent oxidoreductase [Ideonella sp. BN130291]